MPAGDFFGNTSASRWLFGKDTIEVWYNAGSSPFTSLVGLSLQHRQIEDARPWSVVIRRGYLTVGCQTHTFDDWWNFSDLQIHLMHNDALKWWRQNKFKLFALLTSMGVWTEPNKEFWHDDWL